jgi:hypothetical protein
LVTRHPAPTAPPSLCTALPRTTLGRLQHNCGFDYVTHDRAVLAKANQKVIGEKVEKI